MIEYRKIDKGKDLGKDSGNNVFVVLIVWMNISFNEKVEQLI